MMKSILYPAVIIFCLTLCSQLVAQTPSAIISSIQHHVKQINLKKNLKTKISNGEGLFEYETDGARELTFYFDKGKLIKIIEWIGLSGCVQITTYYAYNDKLIFTYTEGKEFEHITSSSTTKPKLTMECRFYYSKGKVVKSNLKGSTKCSGSPDKNMGDNYILAYQKYRKFLQKSKSIE